jgi:ribosomal peptide maturation radical SAM protein 1
MREVVLVCMPFGPVFSPSLGLSLLKAGLSSRGIDASVRYFSIDFAERIGQHFYSGVSTYSRPPHRLLAGEWIFAPALFGDAAGDGQAYVEEILHKHNRDSHDRRVSAALLRRLRAARAQAEAFVDWCRDELVRQAPRIVGFTSVFHQHVASLALAKRLKHALPDCFIVMGGANCEGPMGAETVRCFPFVDAAVSGEGDVIFPLLVERVLAGRPVDGLAGVRTPARYGRQLALGQPATAPMVQAMDQLPIPDYRDYFEQFGRSRYAREWQPSIFFETSRGCWWGEIQHCTFCGLNGSTLAYRSKSAGRALAELRELIAKHPGCDVQVVDNILDLAYFRDFVPQLAEAPVGVTLFYETKANLRKEQIRLLARAGIRGLQPGVESLSDAVLKLMRKGVTALQNIQLLKWCKELGVDPHWNIIWGFPGEPPSEYARMAELAPLLTHLPAPRGFGAIRLDRFSPLFFDAARLGVRKVRPSPPYRHIYPLDEDALHNLAYFFSFDHEEPRDMASYVRPLAAQLGRWKREAGLSELVSAVVDDRLVLLDSRRAAAEPLIVLGGLERVLYEACDAVNNADGLVAAAQRAGFERVTTGDVLERLAQLVSRRIMIQDGKRYLALAVSLSEYSPPPAAVERLLLIASALGRRRGSRVIVPLTHRRASNARIRHPQQARLRTQAPRQRKRAGTRLDATSFSLNDGAKLVIRPRMDELGRRREPASARVRRLGEARR